MSQHQGARIYVPERLRSAVPLQRGVAREGERVLLAVDGGATKTMAVVWDADSGEAAVGSSGPSNRDSVGEESALRAIRDACRLACDGLGVELDSVDSSLFALSGIQAESEVRSLEGRPELPGHEVCVVNDVVAAWASATSLDPGVVVISGTGSAGFGANQRGEYWSAGGWGHVLGDEGGAYWIGLMALRASLSCRDGMGAKTELLGRSIEYFRLSSIDEVHGLVYSGALGKDRIAGFAQDVVAAAAAGDVAATRILHEAGEYLGRLALAIARKLDLQEDRFVTGLVGGTFRAGEPILAPMKAQFAAGGVDAEFVRPEVSPVCGALLLAAACAGQLDRLRVDAISRRIDSVADRGLVAAKL